LKIVFCMGNKLMKKLFLFSIESWCKKNKISISKLPSTSFNREINCYVILLVVVPSPYDVRGHRRRAKKRTRNDDRHTYRLCIPFMFDRSNRELNLRPGLAVRRCIMHVYIHVTCALYYYYVSNLYIVISIRAREINYWCCARTVRNVFY